MRDVTELARGLEIDTEQKDKRMVNTGDGDAKTSPRSIIIEVDLRLGGVDARIGGLVRQ